MISKSIVTVSALVLSIIGCLPFTDASSNIKNIIFNRHHHHSTLATCIDQPVFKHIIDNDDDAEYDAQDVSYSLHHDNMMLSKVVLNADNGTCDIAMDNNGLAVIMAYHPTSGYLGQDKCVYEMCIAEEDEESGGAMDTEQCHHVTIAIHVEDCSSSSNLLAAVLQDEDDGVAVVKDLDMLRDSKEVRISDIFVVFSSYVYMIDLSTLVLNI